MEGTRLRANTGNGSESIYVPDRVSLMQLQSLKIIETIFWISIAIPTIIGNSLVMISLVKRSPFRKDYSLGMASVLFGNCLLGCIIMPVVGIGSFVTYNQMSGKLFDTITRTCILASINSLVIVTYERYLTVRHVTQTPTPSHPCIMITKLLFAWTISIVASVSYVYQWTFRFYQLNFLGDVIVIFIIYTITAVRLRKSVIPVLQRMDAAQQAKRTQRSLHIVRVTMLTEVIFWLFGLIRLVPVNADDKIDREILQLIITFVAKLSMINAFLDPFTYMWFSKPIRKYVVSLILIIKFW